MDFNTPALSINPETISRMNGVLPENMPLMNLWKQQAQQYDLAKLMEFEAQRQAAAQARPYEIEAKRLANEKTLADIAHTGAQTTGLGLTNEGLRMTNQVRATNLPLEIETQAKKLLKDGSEADEKVFENSVYQMQRHADPSIRAQGNELIKVLEWYQKQKQKDDATAAVHAADRASHERSAAATSAAHLQGIRERIKADQQLEAERIKAGKYDRKKLALTLEEALLKARDPIQKAEVLEQGAAVANAAGDEEAAKILSMRAREARQRAAEDAANRAVGAPKPTLSEEGQLTTTPRPVANAPIGGTAALAVTDRPGRQAESERVIIYKNGKAVGTIPKNQVEQAISEGYTVK